MEGVWVRQTLTAEYWQHELSHQLSHLLLVNSSPLDAILLLFLDVLLLHAHDIVESF